MTKGDGVHDTQHATFFDLITKRGKFNTPTTTWDWTRGIPDLGFYSFLTHALFILY